jgi:tetratricopeptide (TPR) repeat protein
MVNLFMPDSLGDARRAIKHHEQALAIVQAIGDRRGEGTALGNLGSAYYSLGDARQAIKHHEQRLAIAQEIGDRAGEATSSFNLALALSKQGHRVEALPYAQAAARLYTQLGHTQNVHRAQQLIAQIKGQSA